MNDANRRDVLVGLGALLTAGGASGQEPATTVEGTLGRTKVFHAELAKLPNGSERWTGFSGTVNTGEAVGLHESVVPAGTPAPPLHRIQHSELLVVAEGELEIEHDGVKDRALTGDVIYIAIGTNHAVRNAGTGRARYFVLQVGGDTKKA